MKKKNCSLNKIVLLKNYNFISFFTLNKTVKYFLESSKTAEGDFPLIVILPLEEEDLLIFGRSSSILKFESFIGNL